MKCLTCNKDKLICSCKTYDIDADNAYLSSQSSDYIKFMEQLKEEMNKFKDKEKKTIKTFNIKIDCKDLCKQDLIDSLMKIVNELEGLSFPLDELDGIQKQITGTARSEIGYWNVKKE